MVNVTLIQRYVVARIVRVGLKEGCEFLNYGGKKEGLVNRIMKTFAIPETGHLQQCTDGKTGIHQFEKVRDLITSFINDKKFEDLIDLYKELFNRDAKQEYSLMDWPVIIDNLLIGSGYTFDGLLRIEAKCLNVGYKTVENAFKGVCYSCEKASTAPDLTQHNKYIDKLESILVSYPFLQEEFVKQMFGTEYLDTLLTLDDIKDGGKPSRIDVVKNTIRERYDNFHLKQSGPKIMYEAMKEMHKPTEPYIQFMGTNHLLAPVITWGTIKTRFAQESELIHDLMLSISGGKKADVGILKALIHRSPNQKVLCKEIFISPEDFKDFDSYDCRKRAMILDEIFDELTDPTKDKVKEETLQITQFTQYPNLTEEEEPVEDTLYMQLIKVAHPEVYETIKASGDESEENINSILGHHLKQLGVTAQLAPSFKYELPEDKRKGVKIPITLSHGEKKIDLVQDLLKTKCPDGEELHKHQQRIVDLIIGIDPAQEGRIAFINPNLGETRSKGPYDFSGVLKFLEDHFYPEPKKPTITEIETSTNVVINQSFIVHDTKGEFFCEYKMTWTPSKVRFMFTHDKPNITGMGRRFHQISELTKPMTQDEAFKEFQSLRRVVIDNGAHNPRVISFAGN